ncbi:MAG: metal-dependent transcriptional regulator [Pyrobaculum arsenaticum]|uniref:Iron dependent repressor n=3 Tax=Pyrobaculum TaxID=2276 RepID=A4WI20_PYRAR|nr:metal-dependent transcriptional regulator [Pyrobaculum arsenaticum]ABP50037.1 iron dependent repressor [Pyrobaculum arsenaticum DSM 13514]MCY0891869.1 metal-dependent transcriptional regulator [Pyrobaculum arsenaticum]NYR14994.1 metal-dependent transcriptional regulator [Pyrobaculum arsenaticum]
MDLASMRRGHEVKDVRLEHYLEAIYALSKEGRATLSALAEALGVKPSSAQKMVRRLEEQGYVVYKGRGGIEITQRGRELVDRLNKSHRTLAELFKLIGVEEELAEAEAEKLEHVIDPKVVERLAKLVEALKGMRHVLA